MKLLIVSILIATSAYAQDFQLKCQADYNSDTILDTTVHLKENTKDLKLGGNDQFQFILTNKQGTVVELQVYNRYEPSRTYATSNLSGPSEFVELSIWNRDFILEARCTLL